MSLGTVRGKGLERWRLDQACSTRLQEGTPKCPCTWAWGVGGWQREAQEAKS